VQLTEGHDMRHRRFSEEQIIRVLREVKAGVKAVEVCRRHGISEQTFYRWKAKFGGVQSTYAKRVRRLEEENRLLKQVVGELTLDNQTLKSMLARK
jgi:putative transposase